MLVWPVVRKVLFVTEIPGTTWHHMITWILRGFLLNGQGQGNGDALAKTGAVLARTLPGTMVLIR